LFSKSEGAPRFQMVVLDCVGGYFNYPYRVYQHTNKVYLSVKNGAKILYVYPALNKNAYNL